MKKIVSAVALAAVAAGFATAEVKVNINSRTRPSLYSMTKTYADSDDSSNTSSVLNFGNAAHSDDLTFKATTDYAGVVGKVTLQNDSAAAKGGVADNSIGTAQTIKLSGEYYGYVKFGDFTLTGGNKDDRFINRYNKTAVEEGLTDSDTAKYGVSNLIATGFSLKDDGSFNKATTVGKTFLYDFSNFSAIAGTRHTGMIGQYDVKEVGDGSLTFKVGAFANNYSTDDYDDYDYIGAGFAAQVEYKSKPFSLQAIFKNPTQGAFGFGAYADIAAVENLNLAVGFTYGLQNEVTYKTAATTEKTVAKWNAFAADLRAFYKVSAPVLVGAQVKLSSYTPDGEDAEMALEVVGTAQYTLNELVTLQLDAGYYGTDLDDNDEADIAENYIKVRPAAKFTAGKNAAVTTAVELQSALNGSDADDAKLALTKMSVKVPVILRVKL